MNFFDTLFQWLGNIVSDIGGFFLSIANLLAKPLKFLLDFLEGIFYFITVLFDIVCKVIMIFVALFQFLSALVVGFIRTLSNALLPSFDSSQVYLPSSSSQGLQVVLDLVAPTGLLTVAPYVVLALIWSAWIYKMFALVGGDLTAKGGD